MLCDRMKIKRLPGGAIGQKVLIKIAIYIQISTLKYGISSLELVFMKDCVMKQVNCPSWDKLSIRNHSVPPFVIRVLCLNTLYARDYFFNQPNILESTNLKEKTDCFYQPDNLESTNPNPIF